MPRLSTVQTNFTAGEISPRLYGRTDVDRYANAARSLINAHPVIHGGAVRRGGFRFGQAAKIAAKKSRLIEFVIDRDHSYMLEFGDIYVRVFTPNGVYLSVELVSPYTEAQLADIDFVQGADTMFLFHPSVAPQRLRHFTDTIWDLSAAPFTVAPFDEQGHALAANLTLSLASVGAGRTATASVGVFLPSDVGRNLVSSAGIGVITGYTSTTVVTITISVAFAGVSIASGAWYLDISPQGFVVPSAKDPVGAVITLTGALTRAATLTLSAKTGAITITASAGVFVPGDAGKALYADSGIVAVLAYTNATTLTGTTTADFLNTSYASGAWGITDSVFRAEDVGKFIRLNTGLVKITTFTSATSVTAQVYTALSSVVAVPPLAWSLEAAVWSATNGYPRTGTLHEQRLWCAGSAKYPQTIWGSRTALYLDFTKGVADSDSCSFTIASDEPNPISYLASGRNMIVHTFGGEFSMQGGNEKPITPTNVQVKPQSKHGSKGVRPLTIGKESVFVQRAGRKVRAMSYQFTVDGYVSPDLTVLAEHITYGGVVSMCYQQEPEAMLWLVLADGTLLSCTLDRDQNVNGWARHYTDGAFESVASIPIGSSEQLWAIVKRTVNGATVRYVEYLDTTLESQYPVAVTGYPPFTKPAVYGCTVDSGLVVDNVAGQATFTVAHLVGKTIDIIADGARMASQVVPVGGVITIARNSFRTILGLHFRSEVGMLTPEVGTGTGTAQGNSMRTGEITLRFLNTFGAQVLDGEGRNQEVPFRHFGPDVLDQPPPLYTGIVRIEMLGWERGRSEITVVQDEPLPMHLTSAVRKFTVND